MGKLGIFVLFVAAACKPMYGAPPQKLRDPQPVPHPKELPGETAKVEYDEKCDFIVTRSPAKQRETKAAEAHTDNGDAKLSVSDKAPPEARTDLIVDGIEDYAAALRKDPFNARATLKLAVAYDKVRKKGCALALLQRLEQLAQNPKFKRETDAALDELVIERNWFKDYRRQALRAAGIP